MSKRSLNRQLNKFSNSAQKPAGVLNAFVAQDPNLAPYEQLRLNRARNKKLENAFRSYGLGWISVWGGWDQNSDEEESYIVSPIENNVTDDYFEFIFRSLLIGDMLTWGRQFSGFIKRQDTKGVILISRGENPTSRYRYRVIHRTALREGYIGKGYTRLKFGSPGMPKIDVDSWGSTLPDEIGTARDRKTFSWHRERRWLPKRIWDRLKGVET